MSNQNCITLMKEKKITFRDKKNISKEDLKKYFNVFNETSFAPTIFFFDMEIETYKEKNSSNLFD